MSWSVSFIGKPQAISEELTKHSEGLTGVSKEEYESALPHLLGLLSLNYNTSHSQAIKIVANGHAWSDTTNKYGSCNVSITALDALLV